ncbi:MAG: HAMP domain-containing protein [Bacteroidota bacterium]|nr:HAMP domain-containing protein [Bacteroidota bacterium]
MKFKIRTKVLFGILFLFVEFVLIGALSIYYISSIKYSSEMMIKNNYWSVHYSENMIQAIDESNTTVNSFLLNKKDHFDRSSLDVSFNKFEENLNLEEKNITEFGEKELVQSIRQKYYNYKSLVTDQKTANITDKAGYYSMNILPLANELKAKIFTVSTLNMQSIVQKNQSVNEMIRRTYKNLSIVLAICFLITFSFMINFPNIIAGPIKKITEDIKEIANNNFRSRITISTKDEFKELAEAINYMAEKLELASQQVAIIRPAVAEKKIIDNNLVLENIQTLLGSVSELIDSISQSNHDEALKKQSLTIKEIEHELSKAIKS